MAEDPEMAGMQESINRPPTPSSPMRAGSPALIDGPMILYGSATLGQNQRRGAASVHDRTVIISRSRRASRATGAQPPSPEMLASFGERLSASLVRANEAGLTLVPRTPIARETGRKSRVGSSYRGPASTSTPRATQRLLEHIYALRKDTRLHQQSLPSWSSYSMLGSAPSDMARATREAIHANAVANAVTVREQTQGAVIQTTRIDLGGVQRADIAQKFAVEQALAGARWRLRAQGRHVASPYGAVALNACASVLLCESGRRLGGVVVASSVPAYGCMPATTRPGGPIDEARRLAEAELNERERLISSTFHRQSAELDNLCKSVLRRPDGPFDSNCASVVLLNYVVSHPRGRALVCLDDRACKLLEALETYWRAENTRRLNQEPRRRALLAQRTQHTQHTQHAQHVLAYESDQEDGFPWQLRGLQSVCNDHHENDDDCDDDDGDNDDDHGPPRTTTPLSGGGKGSGATRSTTSQGLKSQECLEYWASSTGALGGEHSNVLSTLASGDREIVELASIQTILQQAPQNECAHDEVLHEVVCQYAERVAHGVDRVLNPGTTTTPVPVCFRFGATADYVELYRPDASAHTPPGATGSYRAIGFRRVEDEGACAHAFVVKGATVAPGSGARQAILWSCASWAINARASKVPGAVERLALHTHSTDRIDDTPTAIVGSAVSGQKRKQRMENRAGDVRMAAAMQRQAADARTHKMTPAASGMTRAWIVLTTNLVEYAHDHAVADALSAEACAVERDGAAAEERRAATERSSRPPANGATLLFEGEPGSGSAARLEARVQPAAAHTVGLRVSDNLFDWQMRMRKETPTRHLLGQWDPRREATTDEPVRSFCPPPVLALTEWTAERLGEGTPLPAPTATTGSLRGGVREAAVEAPYAIAFQVIGERPMRVVDVIDRLLDTSAPSASPAPYAHALALATIGTAQALYIGDVGFHLGTNSVNSEIANSRRIVHTDLTSHDYLDVWCAYVAGRGAMAPSFVGTPWEGVTGAWIDHGITPPGQNCVNYGDKRNPANMCLSEELSNELAAELCDDHYVHISDSEVAARPVELRGIPWGLPPGASAALEHLDGAYEAARAIGEYSNDFVAEILVLPLSPYAHQVAADCKPGEFDGAGYRWCTSPRRDGETHPAGRSYNPDTTDDDAAIGYSRCLRRPSKNDAYDNPFANPGDEVQAAKAMIGYLAALARMCPVAAWECGDDDTNTTTARSRARARVRALHEALVTYFAPPRTAAETALAWLRHVNAAKAAKVVGAESLTHPSAVHHVASRAAVALNAIHPSTWEINRPMIKPSLARAATLCKQAHVAQLARGEVEEGAPLSDLLDSGEIAEAREWWSAYDRGDDPTMCAWRVGIAPILEQVLVEDGSHDVRREQIHHMRDLLATLAGPTAFLVVARKDASGAWRAPDNSPLAEVRAPDEVRCDHINPIFVKRFHDEIPRGGVLGMKRFQLRQLMVALEAGHLDVHAQVFRLQGQMAYRISSDPSVYERGGKPKSDKACSMVAQDRGHLAFGTIACRRATCVDQRMSWDSNVRVMRNALLRVARPASHARRQHGRAGITAALQREARLCDQNMTRSCNEERASELFELASTDPAAALANSLLAARAMKQGMK